MKKDDLKTNRVKQTSVINNKFAYSIEQISEQTSLSKAFLRNEIQIGNLKAKRVGRRVLVMSSALIEYLEGKADVKINRSKG
jgi:excisionase family DNA binding protein